MADVPPPPPPPPPHGQNPRPPGGGLPDGNYDIFIIPPHSSGGGFLYLPSMQPHRNSFLAGVACTLFVVGVWSTVRQWMATLVQSGGVGVMLLIVGVGVAGWAWGKTQGENTTSSSRPGMAGGGSARADYHSHAGPPPFEHAAPPPPPPPPRQEQPEPEPEPEPTPRPKPSGAANGWAKAKEETRKREEERKRAEELKKRREEIQKAREEAERAAKAKAEKEKWEQARAREKEQRERDARERIARERLERERQQRMKDAQERADREKAESERLEREKSDRDRVNREHAAKASSQPSPSKLGAGSRYEKPTAKSFAGTDDGYSFRPYDSPTKKHMHQSSASSVSGLSEGSYAASHSTARTTPPPSVRGPYTTNDPDKVQIKAVYLFSDSFPTKPTAQLVSNQGPVTDGLILRIKTEGLFIDDDVRGVPQREWDVKAWTLKLVEDGMTRTSSGQMLHVLRATARDLENKKYTFILDESEAYKVALGLQRLRKGSQVRSLGMSGMKEPDVKALLATLGWL